MWFNILKNITSVELKREYIKELTDIGFTHSETSGGIILYAPVKYPKLPARGTKDKFRHEKSSKEILDDKKGLATVGTIRLQNWKIIMFDERTKLSDEFADTRAYLHIEEEKLQKEWRAKHPQEKWFDWENFDDWKSSKFQRLLRHYNRLNQSLKNPPSITWHPSNKLQIALDNLHWNKLSSEDFSDKQVWNYKWHEKNGFDTSRDESLGFFEGLWEILEDMRWKW